MPLRKLAICLSMVLGLLGAETAMGLGLGAMDTRSRLNQRLDAEIPLLSVTEDDLEDIRIKLAPVAAFERAGIPWSHALKDLRFKLRLDPQGQPIIKVTSKRPMREPVLNFLVEVTTPSLRLMREYTVLLDPVHYHLERPRSVIETPTAIRRPLTVPTDPETPRMRAMTQSAVKPAVAPPPPRHEEPKTESVAPLVAGSTYGPIKRGASISVLGFKLRPDKGVTGAQMAWALYLTNPQAFLNGDIHKLKAGSKLRIPSRQKALETPYAEALQLVRSGTPAIKPATAMAETGERPAPPEKTPSKDFALRLLTADEEKAPAVAPATVRKPPPEIDRETLPELMSQLRADVQTLRSENQRLSARLAATDAVLAELQSQAGARDQKIEQLRKTMDERALEPKARAPAPAEPAGVSIPRPMPAVSPTEEPRSPSPREHTSYLLYAGEGLAIVALIALLAWFMVRRRARASRSEPEFAGAALQAPEGLSRPIPPPASWAMTEPRKGPAEGEESTPTAALPREDANTDPVTQALSEADLCLAYGQYDLAETILRRVVESHPSVAEYRLGLLHVLHAAQKPEPFLEQALALHSLLKEGDSHTWDEAAELGAELFPDEPLFRPRDETSADDLDSTMLSGSQAQYELPREPPKPVQRTEELTIDIENLDFPVLDEPQAEQPDANAVRPLDLDIGRAEPETSEEDVSDLADELLAWNATATAEDAIDLPEKEPTSATSPGPEMAGEYEKTSDEAEETEPPLSLTSLAAWESGALNGDKAGGEEELPTLEVDDLERWDEVILSTDKEETQPEPVDEESTELNRKDAPSSARKDQKLDELADDLLRWDETHGLASQDAEGNDKPQAPKKKNGDTDAEQ